MIADVLVELKAKQLDQTFSYKINKKDEDIIKVGHRVIVPFGKQRLEGFVLKIHTNVPSDYELKEIIDLVDLEPVLNGEMLELGRYIQKNTFTNLINCYQAMLPLALKAKEGTIVQKKYDIYLKLIDETYQPKNSNQQQIMASLKEGLKLKSDFKEYISSVNTLIKNNVIESVKSEVYRNNSDDHKDHNNIVLSDQQAKVIAEIKKHSETFYPVLLHGVTGSGKTEVYMNIIEHVIKLGKEAIVLVPEISLTTQLVANFKRRFGSDIAIIHSRLSNGEKYDEWRKIVRKEVSIVIGARSAIFAPFTNLGVIIIDEEHVATYKQENNPKYNTIDIALFRAHHHNIPLVMGSATPSLESYARTQINQYHLLTLDERINKTMPNIELIDLKEEIKHNHKILSRRLITLINDRLAKGEQIILLLNRRGYSTVISCHKCGYTDKCSACDIPLTYHKSSGLMRCHYCGYQAPKLQSCPSCKSSDINEYGMGTQKLEEYVGNLFKDAKIIRMDMDTTSKKHAHEKIIDAFSNHEYDILIGTQMISKGLDFPNVTLVGVLNGDATLNIPDFRSAERTFELLSQVAGRSGRGKTQGDVVIQSYNIDHYSILKACQNDYLGFYSDELKIRKTLKYPPYYNLCLIKASSSDYDLLQAEMKKVGTYLNDNLSNIILGPSNAMMPKINNVYYMQIIIKYKKSSEIINELEFVKKMYKSNTKINIDIDLSPNRI